MLLDPSDDCLCGSPEVTTDVLHQCLCTAPERKEEADLPWGLFGFAGFVVLEADLLRFVVSFVGGEFGHGVFDIGREGGGGAGLSVGVCGGLGEDWGEEEEDGEDAEEEAEGEAGCHFGGLL